MYKILALNLGSTSTKMAYYEDDKCIKAITEEHPLQITRSFSDIMDQADYRRECVEKFMEQNAIDLDSLDAIVSRGGHTVSVEGGVYEVDEEMLSQQATGKYGRHACDLGSKIAYSMCKQGKAIALIVDPPITDEFDPIARLSGHPLMPRRSSFHALSHKATAKRYAKEYGLKYEEINLIVAHLGGGVSVAAHKKGRMIDGDNALDGDGAFSTNRTGVLPVGELAKICFSGEYSYDQVKKMLNGEGGLVAYLGTSDAKEVARRAETDKYAALCFDAMIYQIAKQIGAMSAVLCGEVNAILITGGIAYSDYVIKKIKESCSFIAPIVVYPGENEMASLSSGALEALRKETEIKKVPKAE